MLQATHPQHQTINQPQTPAITNELTTALAEYDNALRAGKDSSKALQDINKSIRTTLGLSEDATLELKPQNGTLTGVLTLKDVNGKPLSIAIGLDSLDGSVVVGKVVDGLALPSSFTTGVRLSPHEVKEKFGCIVEALSILPKELRDQEGKLVSEGYSVIGFTENGEAIATSELSQIMLQPGDKTSSKYKIAVVTFGEKGAAKLTASEAQVIEGSDVNPDSQYPQKTLRIVCNGKTTEDATEYLVSPFPALGVTKPPLKLSQEQLQLIQEALTHMGQGKPPPPVIKP